MEESIFIDLNPLVIHRVDVNGESLIIITSKLGHCLHIHTCLVILVCLVERLMIHHLLWLMRLVFHLLLTLKASLAVDVCILVVILALAFFHVFLVRHLFHWWGKLIIYSLKDCVWLVSVNILIWVDLSLNLVTKVPILRLSNLISGSIYTRKSRMPCILSWCHIAHIDFTK